MMTTAAFVTPIFSGDLTPPLLFPIGSNRGGCGSNPVFRELLSLSLFPIAHFVLREK